MRNLNKIKFLQSRHGATKLTEAESADKHATGQNISYANTRQLHCNPDTQHRVGNILAKCDL